MNVKSGLIMFSLTLSLMACERARMSVAGEPGGGKQKATEPAPTGGPGSSESGTPGTVAMTGTTGETAPAGQTTQTPPPESEQVHVYEPAVDTADATCEAESCQQPIVTDEGKLVTNQPLRFLPRTHRLDILFVLDTSASMRDEHHAIAREINKFIAQLSADVSYRIGVLLAHGPYSRALGVKVGSLYSGDDQDVVIKGDEIRKELRQRVSEADLNTAVAKRVGEILTKRLDKLPIDRSQAQGEAGLLNLYTALSGAQQLNEMKRQGFMRNEAALLVVSVADE
ncbi:MAG: hypothetical protein KDD43_16120, partial [Bdellovibrionales bacterium]|nr:hypothetical protein [Bdellovibrionales bacterium]